MDKDVREWGYDFVAMFMTVRRTAAARRSTFRAEPAALVQCRDSEA